MGWHSEWLIGRRVPAPPCRPRIRLVPWLLSGVLWRELRSLAYKCTSRNFRKDILYFLGMLPTPSKKKGLTINHRLRRIQVGSGPRFYYKEARSSIRYNIEKLSSYFHIILIEDRHDRGAATQNKLRLVQWRKLSAQQCRAKILCSFGQAVCTLLSLPKHILCIYRTSLKSDD